MLQYAIEKTSAYLKDMPKDRRKNIGQFFTSPETARFMAELFDIPEKQNLTILDPGTGSAILSAALLERLAKSPIKSVSLLCYETEAAILPLLRDVLAHIRSAAPFHFNYKIMTENYITSQKEAPPLADLIISNPPYRKIPRLAEEAQAMPHVVHGAPNLYFLFAARSIENLFHGGQMVYIIPRSWTSGAYFKKFRRFLLQHASLQHMHLFISRDKVFEQETVLQETMIIKVKKTVNLPKNITITSTDSNRDFKKRQTLKIPASLVVGNDENHYVFLITNEAEKAVLERLSIFQETLPSLGLKMKTGLTVDFREQQYLLDEPSADAVPMFFSQHMKGGRIVFPIGKHGEYLRKGKASLLQSNSNYLFVKRFTAKEEPRRLQCSIYLHTDFPSYTEISTQNKINFIACLEQTPLSEAMVYGLYCIFNSTLYDQYYRILNGSTQVNSTEVNTMPVPGAAEIEYMGRKLQTIADLTESRCNEVLEEFLDVKNRRCQKIS